MFKIVIVPKMNYSISNCWMKNILLFPFQTNTVVEWSRKEADKAGVFRQNTLAHANKIRFCVDLVFL